MPSALRVPLPVYPQGPSPLYNIRRPGSVQRHQMWSLSEEEERMEEEQQPEKSRPPQKKANLAVIKRKKRGKFLLPHPNDRKGKRYSSQEMFKCECHFCQKYGGSTSGMSAGTRTEETFHSRSLEKLTLDLSNMTLNPCTNHTPLMQKNTEKIENENVHYKQNSKSLVKMLLQEWTE
ncbi:protein FAM156A/FAM156B-like [Cricetulus griseus]|uniref:Protein FAM156A/FAM156B-like n=1 Tax=Cricetulus griseus TaxID=10029 RepID=A0A9J7GK10_CRIGR|nr:protein FAM156A/FAM156B-like [Cricetulus griseus]XP_027287789.1 protein FAM156A/FAM156B-like [Cricetulus griseus]